MKTYGPEYEAWLASLKVGDTWTAISKDRWRGSEIVWLTITGQTNKQWKIGDESYWKNSGRRVGSGSYSADLLPPASETELIRLRGEIKLHNLRTKLSRLNWNDLSLDQLTAIDSILNQNKEPTQ